MLPAGFEFSQGSLQDYVDCPRRFQLKYLIGQEWPAVEMEPALEHEEHSVQGQAFHRLMERYFLLKRFLPDSEVQRVVGGLAGTGFLAGWWEAFLAEPPLNLPQEIVVPEARFGTLVGGQPLVAVFDLLAIDPGRRLVIVDWKTGRRRMQREELLRRLQTRVYLMMAVRGAERYFGGAVDPARVTMVYWFANYPQEPHVFHYSEVQYQIDSRYLDGVIDEVLERNRTGVWPLVEDELVCRFCVYRSLCGRGIQAGLGEFVEDGDDWANVGLDDVVDVLY